MLITWVIPLKDHSVIIKLHLQEFLVLVLAETVLSANVRCYFIENENSKLSHMGFLGM